MSGNSEHVLHLDSRMHRRRLQNLADAQQVVESCLRHHCIRNYVPGAVIYNLGEYPASFSIAPTDYDVELLSSFADAGVGTILIHEEWNDSQRCLGADKLSSHDPEGLRKLIELVHGLGMKALPYVSTGYFEAQDPDFQPEWSHPGAELIELYFRYASCCPASPEWRAYLLPRLERILDEYGMDGLYCDLGYFPPRDVCRDSRSHVSPAPESETHDAALEDLLCLMMDMVHRRNGIFMIHYGATFKVASHVPVYDYVLVGEGQADLDDVREIIKHWEPFVTPIPDMSRAVIGSEDDLYVSTIPYMQFPLRVDGRPFTGLRGCVPGVEYQPEEKCFWTRHLRNVWKFCQQHPDGPHSYGLWDSCPGRPLGRETWLRYFGLYRAMVQEGSRAWLEVERSSLFTGALPASSTASLFVNEESYLVLANYDTAPCTVETSWQWRDRESEAEGRKWTVAGRKMLFLQRVRED